MGEIVPTLVTHFRVVSLRFEPWVPFCVTSESITVNGLQIPTGPVAVYTEKDGAIGCTLSYTIMTVDGRWDRDGVQEAVDLAVAKGYVTVASDLPELAGEQE